MGFLKKITRPISRVLDKIVPNEIKPALPFLAAAAPFFGPTSGIMGTGIKRLLAGGGLNLAAQLAQEGSEGDFNPLSVGIAALTAGATDPGASSYLQSLKSPTGDFDPARTGLQKFTDSALDLGIKGVDKLQGLQAAVADKGILSLEGAKLASIPATQGTIDLAFAEQNRLNKQQIIDDALGGLGEGASDADRALAIRLAMQQYGFSDDEISETIESAGYRAGGRVGFRDGSSTGSFGLDRYASEMISEGKMLDKDATDFLNKYEDMVKEGKADERLFDLLKEYRTLEDKAGKVEDKFTNTKLEDAAEGIMSVDDIKYYDKKIEDIDKKLMDTDERLSDIDTEFSTKGIDASEITRTPDFQEWLKLYMSERGSSRMKSLDHPNADIYLGILGVRLKGRDKSFYETVPRAKDGGLMDLGGKEMDLRGGGFVPIGKKERADDVPARLSKNEFVMTADAVRAAGGGSVNKGAKRMYDLMDKLEARV